MNLSPFPSSFIQRAPMGDRIKWFQSTIALGSPHYHQHPAQARHSRPKFELLFKILEDYHYWENQAISIYDCIGVATLNTTSTLHRHASHPNFELLIKILEDYHYWENQMVHIYDCIWVATLPPAPCTGTP